MVHFQTLFMSKHQLNTYKCLLYFVDAGVVASIIEPFGKYSDVTFLLNFVEKKS